MTWLNWHPLAVLVFALLVSFAAASLVWWIAGATATKRDTEGN